MATKKYDAGKFAEDQCLKWMTVKSDQDITFAYHRYPDARAARGYLAAQPADTIAVHKGKVFHIEIKETKELRRLPKAKISQWGTLKKFSLAGVPACVVVYRSSYKDWVVFNNEALFGYEEAPASFPFAGLTSYMSAAEALQGIFQ